MKLNPVYLLAPKPKPQSIPSRRAFLIAGGTFLAGVGLGGACGYAAGARGSADVGDELKPTGDANLDRLRWLAVGATIEELIENRLGFLNVLTLKWRSSGRSGIWRKAAVMSMAPPRSSQPGLCSRVTRIDSAIWSGVVRVRRSAV